MARKLTSKEYDALSQRLERMADGASKHKGEKDFPKRVNAEERREWRKKFEERRSRYEELMSEAGQAYDKYAEEFKRLGAEMAKDDDTLRGHYGKSNPILEEFGTAVKGKPTGRKPKAKLSEG